MAFTKYENRLDGAGYITSFAGFEHFETIKDYMHYRKLAENPSVKNRQATLQKEILTDKKKLVKEKYDDVLLAELAKEDPEKFLYVKGAVELSNIVGSVLGLAVLAPQVSHAFIHPALRFLGLEKTHNQSDSTTQLNKVV